MALNPGDTLNNGQYQILGLLGRGGYGFVYRARDTLLTEDVAIKELIPALVGNETWLRRFLAEAKATMRLAHDRVVRTHNVFQEGGNYYIVMECMAGGSLEMRLGERSTLPVAQAVRMAIEVCEGLSYAHARGVVHCDLKPGNILFTAEGSAKIADFGIAHVSDRMLSRTWQTEAGFVAGTLPYMSPEQADGVRDDPRIDLYGLGSVLYRALTGRTYLKFDERDTPGATADNVLRIRNEYPDAPSAHNQSVPAWLDGVILKALAKRTGERYASASELRTALVEQKKPKAPIRSEPRTVLLPRGRKATPQPAERSSGGLPAWFWLLLGVAATLILVSFLAVIIFSGGEDEQGVAVDASVTLVATLTATTTPTRQPTATPPPTSSPTASAVPTLTWTPSPEPEPTDTPQPTDSPVPPTSTPWPTSTPLSPTSTSRPTFTPVPATSPPTATPRPVQPTPYAAPVLLEPVPEADVEGRVRFRWRWDGPPLGQDHFFDLRIWSRQEQDAGAEPRGVVAPTKATEATVNLEMAPATREYGPGDYYWTVVVVEGTRRPRVISRWGEQRSFRVGGSSEPDKDVPPP